MVSKVAAKIRWDESGSLSLNIISKQHFQKSCDGHNSDLVENQLTAVWMQPVENYGNYENFSGACKTHLRPCCLSASYCINTQ